MCASRKDDSDLSIPGTVMNALSVSTFVLVVHLGVGESYCDGRIRALGQPESGITTGPSFVKVQVKSPDVEKSDTFIFFGS